ncbi:MAG: hypothetical protein HYS44_03640 [Candidatus Niyogibacteria bacterium]|nr:hypothetical protein [Candidatus Niyogibacteria bacterium]
MEPQIENNSQSQSKRGALLTVLLMVAALGASGWLIWRNLNKEGSEIASMEPSETQTEGQPASTTTEKETQKEAPKEDPLKAKMPSLTRAVPTDADPALVKKISEAVELIRDNFDYLQAWLQLGLLRKEVGDYAGAIEAWKFATILRPQISTAFLNLGDIYGWYLHDNAKAESYLLAGIAAEPKNAYTYYKTYEFYVDVLQDTVKARKILQDGIASNPDSSQDLKIALDNLNL